MAYIFRVQPIKFEHWVVFDYLQSLLTRLPPVLRLCAF